MKSYILYSLLAVSITMLGQDRTLKVDVNHSTVGFNISVAGFSIVTGKFTDFEILTDWSDTEQTITKFSSEIVAASINTGIPDRDKHLASADFFDVEKFPKITFKADSIQKTNFSHFKIYGKLSMHGVTKDIILPLEIIKQDGNTLGFKSITTLNRLDYGVGSNFKHTTVPNFLATEIEVVISFSTRRRKTE